MTALQTISLGTPPQATDGDTARTAFTKVNSNVVVLNSQAALTSATPLTQSQALTSLHVGKRININLSASGSISLPAANTCTADSVVHLRNVGTAPATLPPAAGSGDTVALSQLNPGESVLMDTDGVHAWTVLMRGRANTDAEAVIGSLSVGGALLVSANSTTQGNAAVSGTLSVGGALTPQSNIVMAPAKMIVGDFSNNTYAQRTAFQTSAANSFTSVGALPSGSGTSSYFTAWSKADPTNAQGIQVGVTDGVSATISAVSTGSAAAPPMQFSVNGATRMQLLQSGRVVIGSGADDGTGTLQVSGGSGVITGCTQISASVTSTSKDLVLAAAGSTTGGALLAIRGATGSYNANGWEVYAGGAERLRCNAAGDLHVNETANSWAGSYFSVRGDSGHWGIASYASGNSGAGAYIARVDNVACSFMAFYYGAGSYVGGITTTSTATNYATSSDYRLKDGVAPLSGDDAIEIVKRGKPSTFWFKSDPDKVRVSGFIAHELQAILPEAVHGTKDGMRPDPTWNGAGECPLVPNYQGVDASKAVPTLWAALQRALERIEYLEARG